MPSNDERANVLIEQFIASFSKFDEMAVFREIDPIAAELGIGKNDTFDRIPWRPSRSATSKAALEPLYADLPARFPPLFERLTLSYRWAEVELDSYTLVANPPGPDLLRLLKELSRDPAFWEHLRPAGYIQFARGSDIDYDPVCFDIKRRKKNGDCPIVKIDHEEILCNNRVKVVKELAPSFDVLVRQTIEAANAK